MSSSTDVTVVTSGDYDYYEVADGARLITASNPTGDLDSFYVLISGYLVFFMQCGFAMLSVGSVRSKNAKNIVLKNLLDACFGALCFFLVGYAFAFGGADHGNVFIGWHGFALYDLSPSEWHLWLFQFTFAATAATIVSGAVAERCKFEGYLCYAILLTSWVYPVVVHWGWSATGWASAFKADGDYLFGTGVIDFAGSGVVHMTGGFSALAGAAVIGPRVGRFDADGRPNDIAGHNASLAILGVFILWFGWYGFNPGSALAILGYSEVAALCAINTTLAAAAATVSSLVLLLGINLIKHKHVVWDLIGASNGTLGGLVGITAGCSVVEPWAAIIIGMVSGCIYCGASFLISNVLKVDDPLDAAAVHGFCGVGAVLMAAAFSFEKNFAAAYGHVEGDDAKGFLYGGNGRLFGCAVVFVLAIMAWVLGHMVPFFFLMRFTGLLRVDEAEERAGLDVSHHGGGAYESNGQAEIPEVGKGKGMNGEHEALLSRVQYLEQQVKAMRALPVEGQRGSTPNV